LLMLHVLFSISSFIQVSNNEARKCELNYTKHITYISIYKNVLYIHRVRSDSKVLPGLSAQTKERAMSGEGKDQPLLDDGLSIVYTEAD